MGLLNNAMQSIIANNTDFAQKLGENTNNVGGKGGQQSTPNTGLNNTYQSNNAGPLAKSSNGFANSIVSANNPSNGTATMHTINNGQMQYNEMNTPNNKGINQTQGNSTPQTGGK